MDPNAVHIGSPGGGLWRTRSGGSAWTHLGVGALADETVLHLERDRAMEMGLKLDEKMKVGGWELLFRKARDGGSDFLIHAQPFRE
jgi:hypothetical protein